MRPPPVTHTRPYDERLSAALAGRVPEYESGGGGPAYATGRTVWPLLLERRALDGEWESVGRRTVVSGNLNEIVSADWWRGMECGLCAEHGVDADRLPVPRRP